MKGSNPQPPINVTCHKLDIYMDWSK